MVGFRTPRMAIFLSSILLAGRCFFVDICVLLSVDSGPMLWQTGHGLDLLVLLLGFRESE
jgi:hypothetical protein